MNKKRAFKKKIVREKKFHYPTIVYIHYPTLLSKLLFS